MAGGDHDGEAAASDAGWVAEQALDDSRAWSVAYFRTFYATLMMVMGDSVDAITTPEFAFVSVVTIFGGAFA